MSSNLLYEPTHRIKKALSDKTKFILRKRYGNPIDSRLSEKDIPYLTGLFDANILEIEGLIKMIEKHGEVHLKEEW